jgi:hypothetical protein
VFNTITSAGGRIMTQKLIFRIKPAPLMAA